MNNSNNLIITIVFKKCLFALLYNNQFENTIMLTNNKSKSAGIRNKYVMT